MAEVHIVGTLLGASQFSNSELSCKYQLVAGDHWHVLEGDTSGQTQVDVPQVNKHTSRRLIESDCQFRSRDWGWDSSLKEKRLKRNVPKQRTGLFFFEIFLIWS